MPWYVRNESYFQLQVEVCHTVPLVLHIYIKEQQLQDFFILLHQSMKTEHIYEILWFLRNE
jgi:hypothetical protein